MTNNIIINKNTTGHGSRNSDIRLVCTVGQTQKNPMGCLSHLVKDGTGTPLTPALPWDLVDNCEMDNKVNTCLLLQRTQQKLRELG